MRHKKEGTVQQRSARVLKMNVNPAVYLRGGLADTGGVMRSDLTGRFSLAMAYRFRDEGFTAGGVLAYRELLATALEQYTASLSQPERVPVSSDAKNAMAGVADSLADECPRFSEIIEASIPYMTDWRSFGFLLDHIERIAAELGVISRRLPVPAPPGRAQRMRTMRVLAAFTTGF